ncbi:MAG TPA: alpha/beta fold hydrolase [Bacteroidota bacterium]|nr:alpha/beta fold hydrolase [Bacteroidota bacterium]
MTSTAEALHVEHFTIPREGNAIAADLRYPESKKPLPVIVICHSFMAFKDWGFFPALAERLAFEGFATLVFNFSFNGVAPTKQHRITEFENFEKNTFSREVDDCRAVIDQIERLAKTHPLDPKKIILLGHSRGGGIATVTASEDARVRALVTLASISTFVRVREERIVEWRKQGYLPQAKNTTRSPLRIGIGLLDDYRANVKRLDILSAAGRIHVPWLIMHGREDLTVKLAESEALYSAANKSSTELLVIEKAGHLFNARTKREDNYAMLQHVVDMATAWLHKSI